MSSPKKTSLRDILLVLSELNTFSSDDIESAFEITQSTAARWLRDLKAHGLIESVKIGQKFLSALTDKGLTKAYSFKPVDPTERVLLLWLCDHQHQNVRTDSWLDGSETHTYTCVDCFETVRIDQYHSDGTRTITRFTPDDDIPF